MMRIDYIVDGIASAVDFLVEAAPFVQTDDDLVGIVVERSCNAAPDTYSYDWTILKGSDVNGCAWPHAQ